jgi:hypothetical protein
MYRKMKTFYENAKYPNEVLNVKLEAHGATSLVVNFDEPIKNGSIIIKYLGKSRSAYIINQKVFTKM